MSDEYPIETEVLEIKLTKGEGDNAWKRYAFICTTGDNRKITYSGFATGKSPVKKIEDVQVGDFVSMRCKDTADGKFHDIIEILDIGRVPFQRKGEGEVPKEKEVPLKPITERFEPQETGMWMKEAGEALRSGLVDKKTPTGQKLAKVYFARMFQVLGIKLDEESSST